MLHHLSPLSFALLYIPFVSFILNYLFYRPPCLYFLILEFFLSISVISSTHHICPITFYLSISTQFSGEPFLLPHLPDYCLTYWAELGISTGSHQALIIPPMHIVIPYSSMSSLTMSFLRAWTLSYSFLYILACNSTWYILGGQILLNE